MHHPYDKKWTCCECSKESEQLGKSRNGLTCYACDKEFDEGYDSYVTNIDR